MNLQILFGAMAFSFLAGHYWIPDAEKGAALWILVLAFSLAGFFISSGISILHKHE
ncbi:MAG TPA: hypothetical protein V6D19_13100 [Stenomitos sp.]